MVSRYQPSLITRVAHALFLCAALAFSIHLLQGALPEYLPRDWQSAHESDALSDWKAARLFNTGTTPFSQVGLRRMNEAAMGHPPTTSFWYLPITGFAKGLTAELTSLTVWFLLIPHFYLCLKALRWPAPMAVSMLGVSMVLSTTWLMYHFQVIQWSEHMAFLYVLGWLFLRRGQDVRAGMCLGAAATIKLFPGLMIVFLLLARRWRACFAASVTYLGIAWFMTRDYGLDSWSFFVKQQEAISKDWICSLQNSSLYGTVTQILSPFCTDSTKPTKAATVITLLGSIALVVLATWQSKAHLKRARETNLQAIDLPYALFALLSVYLNAWVWEHYYVFTLQPLFVLITAFGTTWRSCLRDWCDGIQSTGKLILVASTTILASLGLGLSVYSLYVDSWAKTHLVAYWRTTHDPYVHLRAHLIDALNFVPWVVPILLCLLALAVTRRVRVAD